MTDRQRNGFILVLVVGLLLASLVVIAGIPGATKPHKTRLGLDLKGGVQLIYEGQPTAQTPKVTPDALSRAVDIMRQRVDQLGVSEPEIQTTGGNQISVGLPNVSNTARAEKLVGTTARLAFYDWEANALTADGKTVASQLQVQNPNATEISQGSGGQPPGNPGAGSMNLYDAVKLAAKQAPEPASDNARDGPLYFMFGKPGSPACTAAAKAAGVTPTVGTHCLLSGPNDTRQNLLQGLPAGVSASDGEILVVPRGITVLQAVPSSFAHPLSISDPSAQFFVLKDHVALFGNDITNPQQSTDQSGNPNVAFGFTSHGKSAFQRVTGDIAHRGQLNSPLGQEQAQHFAVALDTQLITVPQIDFKQFPDGIPSDQGAEITGGFTISSAQDLATQLRLGALPIKLKLISESQVSATLGKQALHQGLIAGVAGLLVVILFLIAYYRVLGVIATAGLIVYGIYFYALIKLIPITLTLPGIAGLILTIGVAADANIVIFERVKEEIRGGRSIRQGIVTGYRKGLSAIIDANVVTIMTAFILFVLATSDVKGFAFTLGIGTIVSLFTAVLATQAILMTMSKSRMIAKPSALGAGKPKRRWRFDFMGASKYFFTLSGVILLVGALAIGGRGLNLGIDFTSGVRASFGLNQNASQAQVSSALNSIGVSNPTVQKVSGDKSLGQYGYQVSFKDQPSGGRAQVQGVLQQKFGVANNGTAFNYTSIGPTFGKTVANNAVKAIIASLLIIAVYIALRFEWKFAVPVMIALMHDLLITSGVYALTGKEVTTDTVAALLTILGYSLYDTIIVFDRVRENIPRMPRAAFSQIVNRSMSEVLTRSLATTFCTLLPILALLLFGGSTLKDFAFALLIGVASGAYSSIFIASPVLTHWKEREPQFRARRHRIEADLGTVPAYAASTADVEPAQKRARRPGRITQPDPETVSAAEFEQMKREIAEEEREVPSRHTSTLTKRLAHTPEAPAPAKQAKRTGNGAPERSPRSAGAPQRGAGSTGAPQRSPGDAGAPQRDAGDGAGRSAAEAKPAPQAPPTPEPESGPPAPAPDIAENEGMVPVPPKRKGSSKSRSRNRRHGRRR
jgi:SecD/SecF fusion protein